MTFFRSTNSEGRIALPESAGTTKPHDSIPNNSTEAACRAKTAGEVGFKSFALSLRRRRYRFTVCCECESRLNHSIVDVKTKHALTNHGLQKIVLIVCNPTRDRFRDIFFFEFVRLPEEAGAVDGPAAGGKTTALLIVATSVVFKDAAAVESPSRKFNASSLRPPIPKRKDPISSAEISSAVLLM